MELVIVESPYTGAIERNIRYAKRCMKGILKQGNCPFASHILYTQEGILDDDEESERSTGIRCGYKIGNNADKIIFFMDYGMSKGMVFALEHYTKNGSNIHFKYIGANT